VAVGITEHRPGRSRFYDRSCDPVNDTLNCVNESSTTNCGATWSTVPVTTTGFDGDKLGACLAFVDPPNCQNFFLGDYIATASTDTKAQLLSTANGAKRTRRVLRPGHVPIAAATAIARRPGSRGSSCATSATRGRPGPLVNTLQIGTK
jgi:hypothetical protein